MDGTARVSYPFGDGEYSFRLALGELQELQGKCQAGPERIYRRLVSGDWELFDVSETIRIGLIGAGMKADTALALAQRYIYEVPNWLENKKIAIVVLGAALIGPEIKNPGKGEGEDGKTQTKNSTSP